MPSQYAVTFIIDRDCLAFATEPVMMSLTNAIDPESPSKIQLDEVEIKYGLLQVCQVFALYEWKMSVPISGTAWVSDVIFWFNLFNMHNTNIIKKHF